MEYGWAGGWARRSKRDSSRVASRSTANRQWSERGLPPGLSWAGCACRPQRLRKRESRNEANDGKVLWMVDWRGYAPSISLSACSPPLLELAISANRLG